MSSPHNDLLLRLKATVGRESVFTAPEEVGRAAIRMYSQAVQDPNPLYTDDESARAVGLNEVMAPPTLICDSFQALGPGVNETGHPVALAPEGAIAPLRAGNEYEFFQPVHPGDVITLRRKVKRVWEKEGRSGALIFQQVENTYYNQRREALARNNELLYYRPAHAPTGRETP